MSVGWWTAPNPSLELDLDGLKRRDPLPLELHVALDTRYGRAQNEKFVDRLDESRTAQVKAPWYQQALDIYGEVKEAAPDRERRRDVRKQLAEKFFLVYRYVARQRGHESAKQYLAMADQLLDARPCGVYGADPLADVDENPRVEQWANRAGLVKYCPDDAREEAQRVARLYVDRLAREDARGHILRSAVFTWPNVPQWHLGAAVDGIYESFRRMLLQRVDGTIAERWDDPQRRRRDLVGAWACLEAPLSGRYEREPLQAWNVHLNVILVFRRADELEHARVVNGQTVPDYQPLVDAWGSMVHFDVIPSGDVDAMRAAVRELVKYPVKAISEKSAEERKPKRDKFGRLLPPAPPMVEWPDCYVDEWHIAHKGFRRTRSWGNLYYPSCRGTPEANARRRARRDARGLPELPDIVCARERCGHMEKPVKRNLDLIDWFGRMKFTRSGRLLVSVPMPDTRELDARQRRAYFARERERVLTLIQGNKFAAASSAAGLKSGTDPPC